MAHIVDCHFVSRLARLSLPALHLRCRSRVCCRMSSPETTVGHGTRVRLQHAGGNQNRFVIAAEYAPRKGQKKWVHSNHVRYGKVWSSKEDIGRADVEQFIDWIRHELARGGGSKAKVVRGLSPAPTWRNNRRGNENAAHLVHSPLSSSALPREAQIQKEVHACVEFLIFNIVHEARHAGEEIKLKQVRCVKSKLRPHDKTNLISAVCDRSRPRSSGVTKRMRLAFKLTQRKSNRYEYRTRALKLRAAAREELSLAYVAMHKLRLATIVARQDLHELLPEGNAAGS